MKKWKIIFLAAQFLFIPLGHAGSHITRDKISGFGLGVSLGSSTFYNNMTDQDFDWTGSTLNFINSKLSYALTLDYIRCLGSFILGAKFNYDFINPSFSIRYLGFVDIYTNASSFPSFLLVAGLRIHNNSYIYINSGVGFMKFKAHWSEDNDPEDSWNFAKSNGSFIIGAGLRYVTSRSIYIGAGVDYYIVGPYTVRNQKAPRFYRMRISNALLIARISIGYIF